jgi:serine/threonine protein kinase
LKKVSESYHLWETYNDQTIWTHPDSNRKKLSAPTESPILIPSHNLFKILEDIIEAIQFLQKKKIIHGNNNPDNIIIFEETFGDGFTQLRAKLAMAQTNDVCAGWRAPNFRDAKEKDKSELFTLGLIICFTLTGFHPFGSLRELIQCQNNIQKGDLQISEVLVSPEFVHLISSLTRAEAANRADPNHLLGHPTLFGQELRNLFFMHRTWLNEDFIAE